MCTWSPFHADSAATKLNPLAQLVSPQCSTKWSHDFLVLSGPPDRMPDFFNFDLLSQINQTKEWNNLSGLE